MTWAVVLRTGDLPGDLYVYGPIDDETVADLFAAYLTGQVDPAWAFKMASPLAETLKWHEREKRDNVWAPAEHWPPQPGDIWQGKAGERWACSTEQHNRGGVPYLVCLAFIADDSAEEINRKYGPMTLVYRPDERELF